jgi:hypothetical protein
MVQAVANLDEDAFGSDHMIHTAQYWAELGAPVTAGADDWSGGELSRVQSAGRVVRAQPSRGLSTAAHLQPLQDVVLMVAHSGGTVRHLVRNLFVAAPSVNERQDPANIVAARCGAQRMQPNGCD